LKIISKIQLINQFIPSMPSPAKNNQNNQNNQNALTPTLFISNVHNNMLSCKEERINTANEIKSRALLNH